MPEPMDARTGRAAQYVRMSTEHQRYSIAYQTTCNQAYAVERGLQLVRTYTDSGLSGLTLERRAGLKQLLADVLGGEADYQVVLVYDVSRWGRFQDPDEGAHYEFICRAAGVAIEYSAEPFENDGSMTAGLLKHLKRAMAAEYSRELSAKVSRAKRGLSREGYWCGGQPSYGFRRCVVMPDGARGEILDHAVLKARQGQRTVLVAGPAEEVAVVRRIFRAYVIEGLGIKAICAQLNAEGVTASRGSPWDRSRVRRILEDEKYAGVLVVGRRMTFLRKERALPPEQWVRVPGACPALVDPELAQIARANLRRRTVVGADEQLLDQLRQALALYGKLSARILQDCRFTRSASIYRERFGTLMNAFRLAGYAPSRVQRCTALRMADEPPAGPPLPHELTDAELIERLRALYLRTGRLTGRLIGAADDLPCAEYLRRRLGDMMKLCELVGCTPTARQLIGYRVEHPSGRRKARRSRAIPATKRWMTAEA